MSRIASSERSLGRDGIAGIATSGGVGAMPAAGARNSERPASAAVNQDFYDALWSASDVILPQRFNTWPLLFALSASAPARLEIGPGLRPRLPIAGTSFVDISRPALSPLKAHGGLATFGEITALPFADSSFDLVCAFDIIEHIEDDRQAFRELGRIAKDDATVIFSVPLHADRWSAFDALVGHVRRYDPDDLLAILGQHSFVMEQSAIFGMQPRSGWLLDLAVWGLTHQRAQAMRWYNRLFLPLGLFLQRRLVWASGLIDVANVDELLLVCRRVGRHKCKVTAEDVREESEEASDMARESKGLTQEPFYKMKRAEPDEMQAKIDALNITSSNASDKVKAEMQQMDEELEKQHTHRATSQAPSKLSVGSLWHFTIDVDWVPGSEVGLEGLLDFCDRWKFKATIFVAGRFAETYADLIRECRRRGHELGTHGWEHGSLEHDEDFRSASYDQQRAWIRLATEAVENASGVRPVVFRAPSLWVSETTLRALEAEGYRYDSSVPARRFDCGFGRVHYLKYFRAPMEQYRLSSSHLRLPGHSSIIEMAPSAFLFPINLASLRTLGLPVMKWMVGRVSRHASQLVFYCHPHEFVHAHRQSFPRNMSKWNMQGMTPENFTLLDAFVEYMMQRGYSTTLFAGSFSKVLDS